MPGPNVRGASLREETRRAFAPLVPRAVEVLAAHDITIEPPALDALWPRLIAARAPDEAHHLVHDALVGGAAGASTPPSRAPSRAVVIAPPVAAAADALWHAYQQHQRAYPVEVARAAWRVRGLELHVGRVLHEAMTYDERPAWAGRILTVACARVPAPAAVTRVADITERPSEWPTIRRSLTELRELIDGAHRRPNTRRERGLLAVAQAVAWIVHQASGGVGDLDAGWRLAPRLRELLVAAADPAFAAEAEWALFDIAPA